jgi:hypothetical protein
MRGRQIEVGGEFRINHYSLLKEEIMEDNENGGAKTWKDDGTLRYKETLDKLCDGKCS